MASGWSFRTAAGKDPVERLLRVKKGVRITEGDALYAGQRQRARILERTARGVDVDEAPFPDYSTKGPYYYYPNGRVGNSRFSDKQQRDAAARLLRKLTPGKTAQERKSVSGVRLTKSGKGLVFESYAGFKRWLGRKGVDLRGPRSPHMLQGIIVKAGGSQAGNRDAEIGVNDKNAPAGELVLGIYGDAAKRATGHNTGDGPGVQRRFFDASVKDVKQMIQDIHTRVKARLGA